MRTLHPAICRFCAASCPITVDMEDGRPVRATGNSESPTYHGFCCTRGQALPEVMASPQRLLHSMKRGLDGRHHPIASQLAVTEVAERLRDTLDRYGPKSVAVYFGTHSATYPASPPLCVSLMIALQSPMIFTAMSMTSLARMSLRRCWVAGKRVPRASSAPTFGCSSDPTRWCRYMRPCRPRIQAVC